MLWMTDDKRSEQASRYVLTLQKKKSNILRNAVFRTAWIKKKKWQALNVWFWKQIKRLLTTSVVLQNSLICTTTRNGQHGTRIQYCSCGFPKRFYKISDQKSVLNSLYFCFGHNLMSCKYYFFIVDEFG